MLRKRTLAIKVAFTAILAAMTIGGNYALAGIPNVELSSVMVFLSGFLFGMFIGAFVGLISMTIYQFWNPWGAFIPPIGLTVIGCTMFIGIIGGILGYNFQALKYSNRKWILYPTLFGGATTLFFDLVTNLAYSLVFSVPYFIAFITGLPFMFVHTISNCILFGLLTQPISRAVEQLQLGIVRTEKQSYNKN